MKTRTYQQSRTIPANDILPIDLGGCDHIRFIVVPDAVLASLNDGDFRAYIQGECITHPAGSGLLKRVVFKNTSGAALAVSISYGDGALSVQGVVALSGGLPLPTGAATAAKQDTGNTSLASILAAIATAAKQDTLLAAVATAAKQDTGNTSLASILAAMATAAKQDTLLAAVATAAKQDTGNTSLASILAAMATAAKQDTGNTNLASIDTKLPKCPNSTVSVQNGSAVAPIVGAVRLYDVVVYNYNAADQWLFLYDRASAAANGTRPTLPPIKVPGNFQGSISFAAGRLFANGVFFVNSTTEDTLTAGANDCAYDLNYAA